MIKERDDAIFYGSLSATGGVYDGTGKLGSGGSTILSGSVVVSDTAWSGNTDYNYTATITGAVIGNAVVTTLHPNIMPPNIDLKVNSYVSAADTVTVYVRVSTYYTLGATKNIYIRVIP